MSVPFVDAFGRGIKYLRLSVTDRCDLRCRYCMSEAMTFLPSKQLLSFDELDRVARGFIASGVDKIRVTGGEPLVRKDIMRLFRSLARCLRTVTAGTDPHDERYSAVAICGRTARPWRATDQYFAGYARSRQIHDDHARKDRSPVCSRASKRHGRLASPSNSTRSRSRTIPSGR